METIEILGVRDVDFTDDNGRRVCGRSVYYAREDSRIDGRITGKLFVSQQRIARLSYFPRPGDLVVVFYDRFAKPCEFRPVVE